LVRQPGGNACAGRATATRTSPSRCSEAHVSPGSRSMDKESRTLSSSSSPEAGAFDARELLAALVSLRDGDFSARLPGHWVGLEGKIADTFNDIAASNGRMATELERVGRVVGKQGRTKHRVTFGRSSGAWGEMESSVNTLVEDLLRPTAEVTRTIAAVAQGDLLQTVP